MSTTETDSDGTDPEPIGDILGRVEEEAVVLTCPDCGKTRDGMRFKGLGPEQAGPRYNPCPNCEACHVAWDEARAEEIRRGDLEVTWERICPPGYRKTDPGRLPVKHLADVMAWQYGPKGLYLCGPTDLGKTRCMFLLVRRLLDEGRNVRVFDCADFGHECARRFMDGTGEAWTDDLARVEVCFFDDFGKMPLTERVEAELLAVIERRTANELPILATSNMTGADLTAKASADRGAPLVRRLREFCEVVRFEQGD